MDDFRMILTGDYWHGDFQELTREFHNETTLMPFSEICELAELESEYSLIVVAQSRRNQVDRKQIEHLFSIHPHTPVVALSGSWCEGEARSGSPVAGVIRVYWHRWRGRLRNFRHQLQRLQIATWQLPKTLSSADRVLRDLQWSDFGKDGAPVIGISALTSDSFGMLQDACTAAEFSTVWIETTDEADLLEQSPPVVLLDGNSMTRHFVKRVRNVRALIPESAMIAVLNFPRQFDVTIARQEGAINVLSKPFDLIDLHSLIAESLSHRSVA